ncbi:MAG: class I SAM-dependent methyltransferase [Sandaracinaceae bacterium]|nr:class I SAM-dependent methyltransferase [Sandaracinaceae bacterium]
MTDRRRARELAAEAAAENRPTEWFETLYREAAEGAAIVPWDDGAPNPHLVAWLDREAPPPGRALDVGCGYGDNAGELVRRGFDVVGFDVSETAVARARERFGDGARFETADARVGDPAWVGAFDLVVEIYTLQTLPPEARAAVLDRLASWVRPGGTLLVVARARDDDQPATEAPPWQLTRAEIESIGLEVERFEDFLDDEDPPVRRFRATLRA